MDSNINPYEEGHLALFRRNLNNTILKIFSMQLSLLESAIKVIGEEKIDSFKSMEKFPPDKINAMMEEIKNKAFMEFTKTANKKVKIDDTQLFLLDSMLTISVSIMGGFFDDMTRNKEFRQMIIKLSELYDVTGEGLENEIMATKAEYEDTINKLEA